MDAAATPRQQPSFAPRRRGPPIPLRIDTPAHNPGTALFISDSSASTLSSTTDADSFSLPSPTKPRSLMNMKKLSITLPSAQSSTNSLALPNTDSVPPAPETGRRRLSVISLPNPSTAMLVRKGEDGEGSPSVPYVDGPIQILPGIWLGSEENVRDWNVLRERGVRAILNVAKEVITVFDSAERSLRPFMSTPDLNATKSPSDTRESTYYPPHLPSGRPGMHYLKLHWSHGQSDLVQAGFPAAFEFIDQALERGDGVLIHCQCGVSRSATLVIATVMRAATQRSPNVPSDVWALKGMQGAYAFVKGKSKWVSPNMSLIYQLMDYQRALNVSESASPVTSDEEEWSRRRQALDDTDAEDDRQSIDVVREAQALDQAMEDRFIARKSSVSSMSSHGSSRGMGAAWRNKYGRKRTGSSASIFSNGSILSEHLVEEDEERELLGVGVNSDGSSIEASCSSAEPTEDELSGNSAEDLPSSGLLTARPPVLRMPPSAPAHKTAFLLPPPPATAIRSTFDVPRAPRARRRPPPLGLLPPVPSSPLQPVNGPIAVPRIRVDARKPEAPSPHLRRTPLSTPISTPHITSYKTPRATSSFSTGPSQTLIVFPAEPSSLQTRTPSTMTITSKAFPFPPISTPRVSTFQLEGKRKSFIGLGAPPTPTVASSRVDARGWLA